MKNTGVFIPSIDAKDLYLASHTINHASGYRLKQQDGTYPLRKFCSHLDNSLDFQALLQVYYRKCRRKDFSFTVGEQSYSVNVINLTFHYSVKEWNQKNRNTYIKLGYEESELDFRDCIAVNAQGELIGIRIGEPVETPAPPHLLPSCFAAVTSEGNQQEYRKIREPKTIKTGAELRHILYRDGFVCDGISYCRFKRSSGSARVGRCLFINQKLYRPMMKFCSGGISLKKGQTADLAAYEAYISLPSSSMIGTLPIAPENILLIEDYESRFPETVAATRNEKGRLLTTEQTCEITNSIWDGQSLLDSSLFGPYRAYGMVLLRNLMFKSCCFQCNIQQWFQDHGITELSQLNGRTRAEKIEDIKLITTPSSIKYLKFGAWEEWLDHLYPDFGVVKHEKKTHFFGGRLVQTHYQLLNTLQLSQSELRTFLQESLDFAQLLGDRPEVVRYYIKYPDTPSTDALFAPMENRNDVVYRLMCINEDFTKTKYYQEFLHDLLAAYYKNLKNGHVLVNGNYSTLLGNPIEMLQQAIGAFTGKSELEAGTIHSTRFAYDQTLIASRSPHVTMGNIWLPYNKSQPVIDRYFHLTDEIVCINSIGENVLQRLSGADFDSDTVLLSDNPILIEAARRNYHLFQTPTSLVQAKKVTRRYTPQEQADLDIKTSVNKIGEIINLSQELNSLLWDRMYHGSTYEDVKELYYDICQLDVLSGIEIDKAKKEFDIDSGAELNRIRTKYREIFTDEADRKIVPRFFSHLARQKGYYDPKRRQYRSFHTAMDDLQTIVNGFRLKHPYKKDYLPFGVLLDRSRYFSTHVNQRQVEEIYSLLSEYTGKRNAVFASDQEDEDKYIQARLLYHELISRINQMKIGFSTLYQLLSTLEEEAHAKIKNLLLRVLFLCGNESFNKAVLTSARSLPVIEEGGTDLILFGQGCKLTKKLLAPQNEGEFHP